MKVHDATEQAYKNGYEKGKSDAMTWISVKDRLPKEDGAYLVYRTFGRDGWCRVVYFAKDARKVDKYDFRDCWKNAWYYYDSEYGNITISDSVTHWMPLPEAPKEDEEC